jgi:hypothetical protein
MPQEKALVNLTSMEFGEIKESLKAFMKTQTEFSDYNFEGSGLNVLLDLLAYDSQNKAYLANMLANESEIDSAILRSNIVSRAKLLGYSPRSSTASRAVLSIKVVDSSIASASLLLPRGTKFIVRSGALQFIFITLQEYNLLPNALGEYTHSEVEVFEGSLKTFSWDVVQDKRYILPSKKIDTSTLKVAVFESLNSNQHEVFEKSSGLAKIDNNSPAYWLFETDNANHEVKFGDGIFGKLTTLGGVVYTEYLETSGPLANDLSKFSLMGVFSGYENADIAIETINVSSGGADIEASSSIKLNAPRFFQSQNRAVTKRDYESVTKDIYPYAKSVAVWGGEETTPPQYGKVFISIIPVSVTKLTSTNKRDIERKLRERSVTGVTPVILDPKFIKMNLSVYVDVFRNKSSGINNFNSEISTLITEYFSSSFGSFNNDFYYSNLLTLIKNYSRGIAGARADFSLSLVGGISQTEYIFENSIRSGSVRTTTVRLTGQTSFASIEDFSGVLKCQNVVVGSIDYSSGKITLVENLIQETSSGSLEIFVVPSLDDIVAGFNSALILDESRLVVELKVV